jgi:ubiquinone/menaquinone biosynthesis C-methylase UbiE
MIQQCISNTYDVIAYEFDKTRITIWSRVKTFLDNLYPNSTLLDIGCGNGKNMFYCKNIKSVGIDISKNMVDIVKSKNGIAYNYCMTNLLFDSNSFDNIICVAAYHHLSTEKDRLKSINEMYRVLKKDGKCFIQVFAMEQEEDSRFKFTDSDVFIPWNNKIMRYYHVYKKNELKTEIVNFNSGFTILEEGYEKGNWYVILSK